MFTLLIYFNFDTCHLPFSKYTCTHTQHARHGVKEVQCEHTIQSFHMHTSEKLPFSLCWVVFGLSFMEQVLFPAVYSSSRENRPIRKSCWDAFRDVYTEPERAHSLSLLLRFSYFRLGGCVALGP